MCQQKQTKMYKVQALRNEYTENGDQYVGVETLMETNDIELAKSFAESIYRMVSSKDDNVAFRIWSKNETLDLVK